MKGKKSDNATSKAAQLRDNYIYLTIKFVIFFKNIDGWNHVCYNNNKKKKTRGC